MRMFAILIFTASAVAMPPVPRVVFPDPAPDESEKLDDPAALAERIAKNSKSARDRLANGKTEPDTLRDQKQVKDDLDALIKLLEPPPPPPDQSSSDSSNSPMGKGSDSKNKSGSSPPKPPPMGGEPKPMGGEPKPENGSPKPMGGAQPKETAPTPAGGAQPGTGGTPARVLQPHEESMARDFWGHLPDAPRQQMMQFYREQYMGKYKDLLADYYKSLAEKEKK